MNPWTIGSAMRTTQVEKEGMAEGGQKARWERNGWHFYVSQRIVVIAPGYMNRQK